MPGYYKEILIRFKHILGTERDQPHKHTVSTYGATPQYIKDEEKSELLYKEVRDVFKRWQDFFSLCLSYKQDNAGGTQCNFSKTGSPYNQDNGTCKLVFGLYCNISRHHTGTQQEEQYGPGSIRWRVICDRTQSKTPSRRYISSDKLTNPEKNWVVMSITQIIKHVVSSATDT